MLCRALIRGISWSHAIEIAAKERAPATVAALRTTGDPPQYVDGFAAHALHAAIYFVQESRNFTAALDSALAFAGPANYCPVLVGSVGGARWGAVQIESNVLAHCDILPQIYQTADSLARLWPEDPGTGKYSIDPKQNAIDPRGN
jgi:ADP-ribosylglycohydrolase